MRTSTESKRYEANTESKDEMANKTKRVTVFEIVRPASADNPKAVLVRRVETTDRGPARNLIRSSLLKAYDMTEHRLDEWTRHENVKPEKKPKSKWSDDGRFTG